MSSDSSARGEDVPTPRAIGDWIRKGWVSAAAADTPWSIADSETRPEDISYVLDVIRRTAPRRIGSAPMSKATAGWVIRIRRAYPELANRPRLLLRLAMRARLGGNGLQEVQTALTYAPWTFVGARELLSAVGHGRASDSVLMLVGLDAYVGMEPEDLLRLLEDQAFAASAAAIKTATEEKQ